MPDLADVLADLRAESGDLDRLVAGLTDAQWRSATPAPGWTIAHQISHLAWTDRQAIRSATDPDGFLAQLSEAIGTDPAGLVDRGAEAGLAPPAELLDRWRAGRAELSAALANRPAADKLPWYGTWMSPVSMATGRIMETWAHGEDIADALGTVRLPTDRLRHVAFLGVRTLGHSFASYGRPAPTEPVYVELLGPGGDSWAYGTPDATNRVTGPAVDFCLLVTQRRHRADLALSADGPIADEWLDVAQAYAGPAGTRRQPKAPPANARPTPETPPAGTRPTPETPPANARPTPETPPAGSGPMPGVRP